jgi:urate oxidase
MEEFGKELVAFFLEHNPQVSAARVALSERAWEHLHTGGKPHSTAFVQSSAECQTAEVSASRHRAVSVRSGLENLIIMKTAGSEFVGFIKDSLTTLQETTDRLLGTSVRAQWSYFSPALREILLSVFAGHTSKSIQHTLYAMGEAALGNVPEIEDIELTMPNKHCLLVDLSRFGQDNPNEIFVPIDEPHGTIEARLRRQG